jgi:hypothetical protein
MAPLLFFFCYFFLFLELASDENKENFFVSVLIVFFFTFSFLKEVESFAPQFVAWMPTLMVQNLHFC